MNTTRKKKMYSPPTLNHFGTIRELTSGGTRGFREFGRFRRFQRFRRA